jgi:hypothetical protein
MHITAADKFWLVLKANANSTIDDVLFSTNLGQLALQFWGGLDPTTILLATDDRAAAHDRAVSELQRRGSCK